MSAISGEDKKEESGAAAPAFGSGASTGGFTFGSADGSAGFGGFGAATAGKADGSAFGGFNVQISKSDEAKKPAEASGGDADEKVEEEECTATFEPVVQLEEQEIDSGTKEDEVLFEKRSKLYRYAETMLDKGKGTMSWNERGVGNVQVLKNNESGHIRIVMRQQQTLKVIMNHYVTPDIELTPNAGSDKSMVWSAMDYADEELSKATFAIKFGARESALEFKEKVEEAKAAMAALLAGADGAESAEADAAADALSGLSTKEKEEEKPKEDADYPSDSEL